MNNFSNGNAIPNGVFQIPPNLTCCPVPVQISPFHMRLGMQPQQQQQQVVFHQIPSSPKQFNGHQQMIFSPPPSFPLNHEIEMQRQKQMINENGSPNSNVQHMKPEDEIESTSMKIDSVFYELQRCCSEGCSSAESIAQHYRRRPCFKKIELLLSRLKQELNVHQNIVSNINSQGTAWAIKDFIFVYSRIINAWIIMRGYIYDNAPSLNDLRNEFDPDLIQSFINWQEATLNFIKPLLASVENLNVYTHNKDVSKKKKEKPIRTEPMHQSQYDEEFLENFQKNLFTPQCVENSEELQVRAHHSNAYFRAGVMKPLMMPNPNLSRIVNYSGSPMSPTSPASTSDSDYFNSWFSADDLSESPFSTPLSSERLYNRGRLGSATKDSKENPFDFNEKSRVKKGLAEQFNAMDLKLSQSDGLVENSVIDLDGIMDCQEKLNEMYQNEGHKIVYLIREITKLQLVDDFAIAINMIISSIKVGKYGKLADIIGEFKILIQQVKSMMKNADDNKKYSLKVFVNGIESVLCRKAFE